jgi:hypothetical protein
VRATPLAFVLASIAASAGAATFTVTTTADSGAGSLRQAIIDANAAPGADTIAFNIPGAGVHTIALTTWLPKAIDPLTVDGYTQPGSSPNTQPLSQGTNAVLNVEINGAGVSLAPCWELETDSGRIQGLVINRCREGALYVKGSLTVTGNFLGTTPAGTPVDDGTSQRWGVFALGTLGNEPPITVNVGGSDPADRNLISGNPSLAGIYFEHNVAGKILGNLVGTDRTVSYVITNGLGIYCNSPEGVQVGGPGANEGNVIAGSLQAGFYGRFSVFQGNFVGTNPTQTANLANLGNGVSMDTSGQPFTGVLGGLGPGEGNVIAHNGLGGTFNSPAGFLMSGSSGQVTARGNLFYDNRPVAIALGLDPPHPADPGDPDVGPNGRQNAPVSTGIDYGPPTVAHFLLNSTPATTFDLDFYASTSCVAFPVLSTQGEVSVGSATATTDGSGAVAIDYTLPTPLAPGGRVTAIATDPSGNTSEFSQTILLKTAPRSGPAAGGGSVTLSGQLFAPGATVTVGGVAASNVVVTPPYTITASMPAFDAGSAHDVVVTNPGGVSGTLRNGYVADFLDVPPSNQFHDDVVKLVANQVTAGVGSGLYGVDNPVKRQAMAVFVLKAEHGVCYTPPPCTSPGVFADVPCPSPFADWIQAMAAEGITGGCGGGNFCPQDPVRRDQMAPFLLKAVHGPTYVPPSCSGVFVDVPCPSLFANWVEQLAIEGVTSGCGPSLYCPTNPNTRGQMATFLVKALRLP